MVSTLFVQRQLNYVQEEVVTQDFPELLMTSGTVLPISTELPSGAQTYTYKLLTFVGSAAILAAGTDDIPLVNAYAEERTGYIRTLVSGFEYSIEDLEAAEFNNRNIDTQLAIGAREIVEQEFDAIAYEGSPQHNLQGFLNHPNVSSETVLNDGNENGGTNSTRWIHKTPEQIYRDLRSFASAKRIASKYTQKPQAIALPSEAYEIILGTPYPTGSTSGSTILSFFLGTQRLSPDGIQSVFPAPYLDDKGVGGAGMMVSFRKRADKIKLHMAMDFSMLPVQMINFCYRVPVRMRTGAVQILKPMSVHYGYGI